MAVLFGKTSVSPGGPLHLLRRFAQATSELLRVNSFASSNIVCSQNHAYVALVPGSSRFIRAAHVLNVILLHIGMAFSYPVSL